MSKLFPWEMKKILFGGTLLMLLHLFILFNLQFTAWPEMFSYPYLLDNGFDLYKDITLPYQPILVLLLVEIYKLFGYNLLTLQLFTWIVVVFSDVLIFLVSRRLLGKTIISLLPLSLYVLIQPLAFGNMLWFDLATVPFILLAFIFSHHKKFFVMGFFLGVAFFIKQQTGLAILFLSSYFLLNKKFQELIKFFLGFGVVALLILFFVIFSGIFDDYLFWTIAVPLYWYPRLPGYSNWPTLLQLLTISFIFLPAVLLVAKNWEVSKENTKMILISLIGLFIVAFPRFDYFRFQPALATYIILVASFLKKANTAILCLPLVLAILILSRNNLANINLPARFYGPQEIMLAKQIEEQTLPEDKIYLLGVPSIVYVLSNRLPPKPWVDSYVWYMEISGLQEKVIQGFEKNKPKVILWKIPEPGNWYDLGTYQPKKIVEYIKNHYELKENIEEEIQIWQRKD